MIVNKKRVCFQEYEAAPAVKEIERKKKEAVQLGSSLSTSEVVKTKIKKEKMHLLFLNKQEKR